VSVPGWSASQDLRLLRVELGVGEDPRRFEFGEILELRDLIPGRRRGCGGRILLLRLLLRSLLVFLWGPAILLRARDAIADGGGRAGDSGCTGDTSEKRHVGLLSAFSRVERGREVVLGM
jgi:hypothetical protein